MTTEVQLPPWVGDADQDMWQHEVTERINSLGTLVTVGNDGQIMGGGDTLGYIQRYLDTAYGTDSVGSNFTQTPAGLPNNSQIWQGVRNTDIPTPSTNPVEFTWRRITSPVTSQTTEASYRLTGGRQIDWFFDSDTPSNYDTDSGPIIDLDAFRGAIPGVGPAGTTYYQVTIYRRSSVVPATPTGGSFNFRTDSLTPPADWINRIPAGTGTLYGSTGLFQVVGDGIDSDVTWSIPAPLADAGNVDNVETIYRFHVSPPSVDPGPPTGADGLGNGWVKSRDSSLNSNPRWEAVATGIVEGQEARRVRFDATGIAGNPTTVMVDTEQQYRFTVAGTPGEEVQVSPGQPTIDDFTFTGTAADALARDGSLNEEWSLTVPAGARTDPHVVTDSEKFFIYPQGTSATSSGAILDIYVSGRSGASNTTTATTTQTGPYVNGAGAVANAGDWTFTTGGVTPNPATPSTITTPGANANQLQFRLASAQAAIDFVAPYGDVSGTDLVHSINRPDPQATGWAGLTTRISTSTGSISITNPSVVVRVSGDFLSISYDTHSTVTITGSISVGDTGWTGTSIGTSITSVTIAETNDSINRTYDLDTDLTTATQLRNDLFNQVSTDTAITNHYTVSSQTATVGDSDNVPVVRLVADDSNGKTFTVTHADGNGAIDTATAYTAPAQPTSMRVQIPTASPAIDTSFNIGSNLTGTALFNNMLTQLKAQSAITDQFVVDTEQYDVDMNGVTEEVITLTANNMVDHSLDVTFTRGNLGSTQTGTIAEGADTEMRQTTVRFDFQQSPASTNRVTQNITLGANDSDLAILRDVVNNFNIPGITATLDSDIRTLSATPNDSEAATGDFIRSAPTTLPFSSAGNRYIAANASSVDDSNNVGIWNFRNDSDANASAYTTTDWSTLVGKWLNIHESGRSSDDAPAGQFGYLYDVRLNAFTDRHIANGNLYAVIRFDANNAAVVRLTRRNLIVENETFGDINSYRISEVAHRIGNPVTANDTTTDVTFVNSGNIEFSSMVFNSPGATSTNTDGSTIRTIPIANFRYNTAGAIDSEASFSITQQGSGTLDAFNFYESNPGRSEAVFGLFSSATVSFGGISHTYTAPSAQDSEAFADGITALINSNFGSTFTAVDRPGSIIRVTTDTDTDLSLTISVDAGQNRSGITTGADIAVSSTNNQRGTTIPVLSGADGMVTIRVNDSDIQVINVSGLTNIAIANRIRNAYNDTPLYTATVSNNVVTVTSVNPGTTDTTAINVVPGRRPSNDQPASFEVRRFVIEDGVNNNVTAGAFGSYQLIVGSTVYPSVEFTNGATAAQVVDQIITNANNATTQYRFNELDSDTIIATSTFFGNSPDVTINFTPGRTPTNAVASLNIAKAVDSEGSTGEPNLTDANWEYFVIDGTTVDTELLNQGSDGMVTVNRGLILDSTTYNVVGSGTTMIGSHSTGDRNSTLVFTGATNVAGFFDTDTDDVTRIWQRIEYSTDGGSTWQFMFNSTSYGLSTSFTPLVGQFSDVALGLAYTFDAQPNTTYQFRARRFTSKTGDVPNTVFRNYGVLLLVLEELRE